MIRSCYIVLLLNFAVDMLLLIGSNQLCAMKTNVWRCALAAVFGALYSVLCLVGPWNWLSEMPFRLLCLLFVALIAFGLPGKYWRNIGSYCILKLAIGKVPELGQGGVMAAILVLFAGGILFMLVRWGRPQGSDIIPVEITFRGNSFKMMALRDTGNILRDPVTGGPVLVIGAQTARRITGLTRDQLRNPVEVMASSSIPGLRVIPYHTVGEASGLLLALKLADVTIDGHRGSHIVAFSLVALEGNGNFQALSGGVL